MIGRIILIVSISFVIIISFYRMSNFEFQEFPFVRYKASKGGDGANGRELIPKKLAEVIWKNITTYKSSIPNFPSKETCELLIVDRSIDQVSESQSHNFFISYLFIYFHFDEHRLIFMFQIAPIIHEWTYDAMCHDLLDLEGNKYVHEVIVIF